MIPQVKTWNVRYWHGNRLTLRLQVRAINKRFAKWAACDHMILNHADRMRAHEADRVTVSVTRPEQA